MPPSSIESPPDLRTLRAEQVGLLSGTAMILTLLGLVSVVSKSLFELVPGVPGNIPGSIWWWG
jgi:hypothetical protein